jgi:hypothetical protein
VKEKFLGHSTNLVISLTALAVIHFQDHNLSEKMNGLFWEKMEFPHLITMVN